MQVHSYIGQTYFTKEGKNITSLIQILEFNYKKQERERIEIIIEKRKCINSNTQQQRKAHK